MVCGLSRHQHRARGGSESSSVVRLAMRGLTQSMHACWFVAVTSRILIPVVIGGLHDPTETPLVFLDPDVTSLTASH